MRKSGFTLAEVLITLGIIGVVAALTMPSLITKYKEKEAAARLKKTYSTLANAYMLARNEHGDVTDWFEVNSTPLNSQQFFENLKPYLNVTKDCGLGPGCFTPGFVKTLDGRDYFDYDSTANEYHIVLADGTSLIFMLPYTDCQGVDVKCGNIKIDIDGLRGAYTLGKDFFTLDIHRDGIYPSGAQMDTTFPFENYCNKSKTTNANGRSCTAWVIYNENMDYLHCDDLSWNGKTTCK
ncbi:MAG: type II secretion system GspH family protein [Heliobacteriaceae bacterium]|jgi:prepilin-type N-terminal cleavage/methylation domain-containing protein|nr:type II secretion system GspH family protein [Heliobacteriaceae bacterium]